MPQPWVAIQRNPMSGSGAGRQELLVLVRELKRRGITPRLFSNRDRLAAQVNDPQRRNSLRCLVAAGGDGTVSDLINRFPGVPLAILPLGTENLLARHLKIPRSGRFVAEQIAAGSTRRVDLCRVSSAADVRNQSRREWNFVVVASVGFDADVIHRTHAGRRGRITKWFYLQPIWEAIRTYRYPRIRCVADGRPVETPAALAVVTNLPEYALRLPVASCARGDDGRVDVRLFRRASTFQLLRYLVNVLFRRHEQLPDVACLTAAHVRFESDEPVPIQVDGDPAGFTPAEMTVLPGALELYAGRESPRVPRAELTMESVRG